MGGFPAYALMFRLGFIKQGAPVVHEERPLYADKPIVVTPAMREYLGRWIEP